MPPRDADPPIDALDAPALAAADTLATEWLLTNALGGFAMGTLVGVPTRRYHAHLVASLSPPVRRVLVLSQIAETLTIGADNAPPIHLQPFHFAGSPERPDHDPRLVRFERGDGCLWVYDIPTPSGSARVERRVTLADARNAVAVEYTVDAAGRPWRLDLRPLTPLRDFHAHTPPDAPPPALLRAWTDASGRPWIAVANDVAGVTISCDAPDAEPARFTPDPARYANIEHAWEARRGLDAAEDQHSPGVFTIASRGSPRTAVLHASIDAIESVDAHATRAQRRRGMISAVLARAESATPAQQRTLARLACAADDFVVRRDHAGVEGRSIIAGYPWFSDWGRDSMISLPGLLLATGRHAEAFGVLRTFAHARRNGLVPNRFDDEAGPAHYNTADASLWFVHACCRYLRATADRHGFFDALAPACMEVVEAHKHGTDYAIGADPADGLVAAGDVHTQLTWMDARRDGVTFTPRHGKPVEINALWHNALASLADAFRNALDAEANELATMARRVAASFRKAFADGPGGGLVDCLYPDPELRWRRSAEIRPNQVFAVSLPHSPLEPEAQRRVLACVRTHLLTPVGLRTLAPTDPGYRPRFEGPLFDRDAAYHNGTVWPWLLGPYIEATLRVEGFTPESRARALALAQPLAAEMDRNGIGHLWEVYDADEPRHPDGCPAQAWSTAELLRTMLLALTPSPLPVARGTTA